MNPTSCGSLKRKIGRQISFLELCFYSVCLFSVLMPYWVWESEYSLNIVFFLACFIVVKGLRLHAAALKTKMTCLNYIEDQQSVKFIYIEGYFSNLLYRRGVSYKVNIFLHKSLIKALVCENGGDYEIWLDKDFFNKLPLRTLKTVIAHELGHLENGDFVKKCRMIKALIYAFSLTVLHASLKLNALTDFQNLAYFFEMLTVMVVCLYLELQIFYAISRKREHLADIFAVEFLGKSADFKMLCLLNSTKWYSYFFNLKSHPSDYKRLKLVEQAKRFF